MDNGFMTLQFQILEGYAKDDRFLGIMKIEFSGGHNIMNRLYILTYSYLCHQICEMVFVSKLGQNIRYCLYIECSKSWLSPIHKV